MVASIFCLHSLSLSKVATPASMNTRNSQNEVTSLSLARNSHYNTLIPASAVVTPLNRVSIVRPPNIDSDSSHRPFEAQHRPPLCLHLPPGALKKLSALFTGDNSLHCSGSRLSFRGRNTINPHSSSICCNRQDAVVAADLCRVLPD